MISFVDILFIYTIFNPTLMDIMFDKIIVLTLKINIKSKKNSEHYNSEIKHTSIVIPEL